MGAQMRSLYKAIKKLSVILGYRGKEFLQTLQQL